MLHQQKMLQLASLCISCVKSKAYLVSNDGLLYGGEVLERGEQDVAPRRAPNVFDEVAKLLAQSNQDFVLVLDRLCDKNVRLGLYRRIASEDQKEGDEEWRK